MPMKALIPAIVLVVAIVAFAWFARRGGGVETVPAPGGAEPHDDADDLDDDEDWGEQEGEMVEAAAVTSDGWAFVPRGEGLELVPPGEDDELLREQAERHGSKQIAQAAAAAPINPQTGRRLVFWRPGEHLSPGDLIAARVVRGAPDVDPWRLEALGRDDDYRPFAFETEEAARVALELVTGRIVRPRRDEHGDPMPVGVEDFVVARRKYDETEQALAMDPDEPLDE